MHRYEGDWITELDRICCGHAIQSTIYMFINSGDAEAPHGRSLLDGPLGLCLPDGPPGLSLPDGHEMRSLATPQKAKPPVVPNEVDGSLDGVDAHDARDQAPKNRKKMCTPNKDATPVKSPFCKKGRVGSVKKGKAMETTDVAMPDTTSPVKSLTLDDVFDDGVPCLPWAGLTDFPFGSNIYTYNIYIYIFFYYLDLI